MEVKTITPCCEGVLAAPLSEAAAPDLAAAFKVMADPIRLRVLSYNIHHGDRQLNKSQFVRRIVTLSTESDKQTTTQFREPVRTYESS